MVAFPQFQYGTRVASKKRFRSTESASKLDAVCFWIWDDRNLYGHEATRN